MGNNKTDHPHLRDSETLERCNSCNLIAASPRGSLVRPSSISLTEEGASPTAEPISAKVMPFRRRSEMRDDHVTMPLSLRCAVDSGQPGTVTEFRLNRSMGKRSGTAIPSELGSRIKKIREATQTSRKQLALRARIPYSTLSGIENGDTQKPSHGVLSDLANALQVTIEQLVGTDKIVMAPDRLRSLLDPAEYQMILEYRSVTPSKRHAIEAFVTGAASGAPVRKGRKKKDPAAAPQSQIIEGGRK